MWLTLAQLRFFFCRMDCNQTLERRFRGRAQEHSLSPAWFVVCLSGNALWPFMETGYWIRLGTHMKHRQAETQIEKDYVIFTAGFIMKCPDLQTVYLGATKTKLRESREMQIMHTCLRNNLPCLGGGIIPGFPSFLKSSLLSGVNHIWGWKCCLCSSQSCLSRRITFYYWTKIAV